MAQETVGFQISGINNQLTDDFGTDNDLEVTGGGRGWTATTTADGEVYSAKGTSKLGAAEALYQMFKDGKNVEPDEDIEEIEGCADECQSSESDFCRCKCGGINHGALVGRKAPVVQIGKKLCKCGCGETTNRTFVPGHDARFHALEALTAWAEANGVTGTEEQLRKAKAAAVRKAARERRAKQRAAATKAAEKVAKTVKAKPAKSKTRKSGLALNMGSKGPAIISTDDLPF